MSGERRHLVRRGTLLYSLAATSAGLLVSEFLSGIILWFVLPCRQGWFSSSVAALGIDRHTWIDRHDWAALVLTAVAAVRAVMHRKWIVRQTRAYVTRARRTPTSARRQETRSEVLPEAENEAGTAAGGGPGLVLSR